jgi:hypothetical protein
MTSIFFGRLQLPSQRSRVQVWTGPHLWLVSSLLLRRQNPNRMTKVCLPRVFNNSYFRVVFNSRPSPLLEKDRPLVDHTHVYQSIFHNGATDWRFSIVIISRTNVLFTLFFWTFLQTRVGTHKTSTQESMKNQTVSERIAKSLCGLTALKCI